MKKSYIVIIIILQTIFATNAFARGRGRILVDRLMREVKRETRISRTRIESEQRMYESQLLNQLRVSSGAGHSSVSISLLRNYLRTYKGHPQNIEAVADLIESISARGNVTPASQQASASILARVMLMESKGRITIEPRDLIEMDRNWTVEEREIFSDVLLEAQSILANNVHVRSPQRAFEQALRNRDMLEDFNRRCK